MTEERGPAQPQNGKHPPFFISFEGTEGSGKSTQASILAERLRASGFAVTENQEPGTTSIGKQIRSILLDPANQEMTAMTELLLMFAARAQAASEIILPALRRGHIIISDRFTDSTMAYQGYARGLGFDQVQKAHRLILESLWPDLTLYIDVDLETGLARARQRNSATEQGVREARIDSQSLDFHRRVQEGYRKIAEHDPRRFRVIDGTGEPVEVARRVWNEVSARLSGTACCENNGSG
jgi:dTMP kinase